ncbi:hypothetical protein MNQ95_01950 [Pseudoxanthomonas daejeonensis]|uniref:hypothetical protein n=1 Tax=Pseudoxanthomonas daejeonensis TaxID=266062 RepID=UPI001F5458FB|nr:hypothetical protein [Pseudoxanthomonas daejeonensis]UNK57897.1 hypothetical protein MNQ95_01950 [Pseudoxanthomonas daejeonensis]
MSRWTDQFKNHPIHEDFKVLGTTLRDTVSDDALESEDLARLRKIHAFIGNLMDAMDPEIIGPSTLNNMHANLQGVINNIAAFRSGGNLNHLHAANGEFDNVISFAASTPFMVYGSAKASITKAAIAYSDSMHQSSTEFRESMIRLAAEFTNEYSTIKDRFNVADGSLTKLENRISVMEAQLPTQLSGYNTDFQNSEKTRSERFENWTVAYQEKLDQQFVESAKKFSTGEDAMHQYLDKAARVLGSVVDTGQAGAYATYASEEKRSANLYRKLAIGLMILAALVLFLPEFAQAARAAAEYSVDWRAALHRLPFSIILFAPALYLAKESSRHRTNEVLNRRREHILTTIGPYLALLDPKKAEEIKSDVARSIFTEGAQQIDDRSTDAPSVIAQVTNLVDLLLKRAK